MRRTTASTALPLPAWGAGWRIVVFFIFAFAAGGVIQPFLMLYLKEVGLTGTQIGVIQGWTAFISIVVTPLIGILADRTQRHRVLLGLIVCLKGLSAPLMLLSTAWAWLVGVVSLRIITAGAQDALMNRLTISYLQNNGRTDYGAIRFWGAVSFAATSLLAGLAAKGRSVGIMFPLAGLLALIAVFFVSAFPSQISPLDGASRLHENKRFLLGPAQLSLLLVIFLFTVARSGYDTFGFVFLSEQLFAGNDLIGFLGAVGGLAPIPAFYFGDWCIRNWGRTNTMALGLVLFCISFFGFSLLPDPLWALPLVILLGFGSALFLVSMVVMIGEFGLPRQAATEQMLAQLTIPGLAGVFAQPLSGWLFDWAGGRLLFALDAGLIVLTLFVLLFCSKQLRMREKRKTG